MNIQEFKQQYQVEKYPLKQAFRRLGVRYGELACYLGVSVAMVSHYLNAFIETPSHIEEKMQRLAKELQKS